MTTDPKPAPLLVNAEKFEAVYLDGRKETVTLRRLSIRQLYEFTHLLDEERVPALVALCAGQPVEWIDTLSDETFGLLSAKCIELNFPRAMTLAASDPVIAMRTTRIAQRMEMLAVLSVSRGARLSVPSPAPAPSASPAATGSESPTSPPAASSPSSPSTGA